MQENERKKLMKVKGTNTLAGARAWSPKLLTREGEHSPFKERFVSSIHDVPNTPPPGIFKEAQI